jgi:tRNA G18 (ribose-2'-O)-methylase SpoU
MSRQSVAREGRGFFAIGIEHTKTPQNIGTLWRSANLYGAAFIYTVGARYKHHSADTMNTPNHIPLFNFDTIEDLFKHVPFSTPIVGLELTEDSVPLSSFVHPERACYLLGAEDHGLSKKALKACHHIVQVETLRPQSLNVSVAGSILMHDRHVQLKETLPCIS